MKYTGLLLAGDTIVQQLKIGKRKCNYNNVSMTNINVNNACVTNYKCPNSKFICD